MRFIVDFFRYVIFGLIGLMIAGLVYGFLQLSMQSGWAEDAPAYLFLAGAALIALFVLSMGIAATFISMHDRHIELVSELRKIRESMGQGGVQNEE